MCTQTLCLINILMVLGGPFENISLAQQLTKQVSFRIVLVFVAKKTVILSFGLQTLRLESCLSSGFVALIFVTMLLSYV